MHIISLDVFPPLTTRVLPNWDETQEHILNFLKVC